MVAADAGDDLLLFRLADGVVVVPHQLDLGVVGVAAGQAVEHAARVEGHHAFELLGEFNARLMGLAAEELRVAERSQLGLGDLGQFLLTVAEGGAPQPGEAFEVLIALVVPEVNTLRASMDLRPLFVQQLQVGGGVQQVLKIARLQGFGRKFVVQGISHGFVHRLVGLGRLAPANRRATAFGQGAKPMPRKPPDASRAPRPPAGAGWRPCVR